MSEAVLLHVKWGKEAIELKFDPKANVKGLKAELSEKTNVPEDRMKLMAKSKGLWKGVLKDDFDLTSLDWSKPKPPIHIMLMGSAAKLDGPKTKTVFVEDLPPEEIAKVQEPSGLVNLGNTCYLNSVVQCLRVVPQMRKGLAAHTPRESNPNELFLGSLNQTYQSLDRQPNAFQPTALVSVTKMAFPQFAQRGPHGTPMQQDAEEFYSGLLTLGAAVNSSDVLKAALPSASQESLMGANNWIDALFGAQMEETLTCDECEAEEPVKSYDLHRKLTCNIQGGSDGNAANVAHIMDGIELFLNGKMEKNSEILGRNATWTRKTRISRLPPILTVQFGRFYWKATPNSEDHQGVKCKVMKPVAFGSTLDVFDFCSETLRESLQVHRKAALAAEEDAIQRKLEGQVKGEDKDGDAKMEDKKKDEMEVDEDLQAALAMSIGEDTKPVGPGLPDNFQGVYELFAVVTHKGRDADGGHYMAWVKAENNSGKEAEKIADTDEANEDWFVFDDDEVSPCKTEDVLKLKGGGDWHMSYLNFYRARK